MKTFLLMESPSYGFQRAWCGFVRHGVALVLPAISNPLQDLPRRSTTPEDNGPRAAAAFRIWRRGSRFATPSQARAVRIRDGGCIFPSCDRPRQWCDIHHIDEWLNGGNTDVARMCFLCRRHHTLIHNSQWTITVEPAGTFRVTHPIRAP